MDRIFSGYAEHSLIHGRMYASLLRRTGIHDNKNNPCQVINFIRTETRKEKTIEKESSKIENCHVIWYDVAR